VSRFLAELGAVVIDADQVGHEAFKAGTGLWREVVDAFGKQVLTPGGDIDRSKLGEMVFDDPDSLARLNQIMHPRMYNVVKAQIEDYRRQGVDVVVLEVILLIEAGWTSLVDEVWVTVAPEEAVVEHLKQQRGLNEEQIRARINSQLSAEERVKHADVVINNNCSLAELRTRVEELWRRLH
jgi:dephospho-CoA kinase